ncbi:hypothetical protein L873DRAFT_1811424, partial [Choiromyces venosus 120613-1]
PGKKDKSTKDVCIGRRQGNTGDTVGIKHSKLEARSPGLRRAVSEIKLKRTDTTLDLSLFDC